MADLIYALKFAVEQIKEIANSNDNPNEKFTSEKKVVEYFKVIKSIFGLILTILISCLFIYIWIRTVLIAYECSLGDSIFAFLFTSIYCIFKLGTLIRINCKK